MTTNNQLNSSDLPLAGGTMSGAINMGTFGITNMADPVNAQDAVTKNYADNIISGGSAPVVAASTAALTVTYSNGVAGVGATLTNAGTQATFALDGQSPTVGQRVLIKNQVSTFQNGIYTVTNVGSGSTNWVLTRALDYNTVDAINDTGVIPVTAGTVNATTGWINTTVMVTIGTTAITYVQFTSLITLPLSLANGGLGAAITASNGGIFYSNASTGALLAGTATAGLALLSGANTSPTWSNNPPITKVNTQIFTATGAFTYTPTAGTVFAEVVLVGAGAASGGVSTSASTIAGGGGGGGGAVARFLLTSAQIGSSLTGSVGTGGTTGTAGNHPGNNGGNTTLATTSGWTAGGGTGGGGMAGVSTTGVTAGGTGGSGGTVTTGTGTLIASIPGKTGGTGVVYVPGAGSAACPTGGVGGDSPGYGSGATSTYVSGTGSAGSGYGSGASGATNINGNTTAAGTAGQNGVAIFIEYIST
jgi:hypothetical protein